MAHAHYLPTIMVRSSVTTDLITIVADLFLLKRGCNCAKAPTPYEGSGLLGPAPGVVIATSVARAAFG